MKVIRTHVLAGVGRWGRRATLLVATALAVAPIYWMLRLATASSAEAVSGHPSLLPGFHSFGGITHPPVSSPIGRWFLNTALVAAGTAVISLTIATIAAFGLSRFRFRGRGTFSFLVLFTQMLPGTLLVVPLYGLLTRFNVINNLVALVVVDAAFVTPVCLWVIKGSMDSIPRELDESARVDGSGMLGVLRRIVVPLAAPGIGAGGIVAFFFGWNDFLFANTFMSSEKLWPLSKGLDSMVTLYSTPIPLLMAVSVVYCLPPVLFFAFMQRRMVAGLAAGAVKA